MGFEAILKRDPEQRAFGWFGRSPDTVFNVYTIYMLYEIEQHTLVVDNHIYVVQHIVDDNKELTEQVIRGQQHPLASLVTVL